MNKNNIIETYYRNNYDSLIKIARRRVGNYSLSLAEEAVQEAFSRAIKYFSSYRREEQFDKWFKRILNNCINYIKNVERNRGVTFNLNVEIEELEVAKPFEVPVNILQAISRLSKRDEEIIRMYFFYGFKSREIAEFMGIQHNNVRQIILLFRRSINDKN